MNQGTVFETVTRSLWNNLYPCYNVQRWLCDTVGGITDAQLLADYYTRLNLLIGEQDDFQTSIIKYQSFLVNEVYPTPRYIGTIANTKTVGSISTNPLPIGAVISCCEHTSHPRRKSMKYFSGLPLSQVTGGVFTSAVQTMVIEAMTYYGGHFTLSAHVYKSVVWSRLYQEYSLVEYRTIDPVCSYFRRRRPHI